MKSKLKKLMAVSIFCGAALLVGVVVTPYSTAENKPGCDEGRYGTLDIELESCLGANTNCFETTFCYDQEG